jgi:hypothetical protein
MNSRAHALSAAESISQDRVIEWHLKNGGHNGRLAGHALRLLHEAVELCVNAGASEEEIHRRVAMEADKARSRSEFSETVEFAKVRDELADISFLVDVVAHHTGSTNIEAERMAKLNILHQRAWEADADGVLWRPGFCP